jgi:type I restriction enzyme, S subunit
MKNKWPIKPLKLLCDDFKQDIVDGPFGSELQRKDYIGEGVPVLKIQNIKPFEITLKKMDYVSPAKFIELKRHSYRSGDIVITKLGSPLGVSAIVDGIDEGLIVADIVRIRAQRINTKYLCYHLNSQRTNDFINSMQKGTTRPRVTLSVVRELPIFAPPLPEQQRIVGILDKAFDGIATAKANAEKNLQNVRSIFKSHIQSIFTQRGEGWKRVRIEDVCESIMDCVNKTAPKVEEPTPFKMIRTTNVRNGQVNLDSVNYVTEDVYRIWTRRQIPQRGDVILTREAPMGEIGMLLSNDNVFLGQRLVSYRANPAKLNNRFLLYALQSGDLQGQIRALASGSTVQHMRVPDSKNLQLPLPGLSRQEKIVATLDSLREETQRLESIYQQKLAALEALKKSLLHQAFNGEL